MSDLIEREDAIRAVGEAWGKAYRVIDALKSIPSAERIGEWIEHRPPTNDYCGMVECPFCGEELVGEPTDFNYCPNCGCRMKGADDE